MILRAVEAFLSYEQFVRNAATGTVRVYGFYLGRFARFWALEEAQGRALDARLLERHFEAMRRRGGSDAHVRNAYKVLRCFFGWSARRGVLPANPMLDMRPPIVRDRPRRCLSQDEVLRLLDVMRRSPRMHAARDRAAVAVMFYAGLRVSEALGLAVKDLDFQEGIVHVRGKGGKLRQVPLHPELTAILRAWLLERAQESPWLFPARAAHHEVGGKLDADRLRKMLRTVYLPAAGIKDHATPHALRRAFATTLRKRQVPIEHVQKLLGHASIETTRLYIREMPQELRASVMRL